MNTYACFYKGRQIDVEAATTYEAQQIAAAKLKVKKAHEIAVVLAAKENEIVIHTPDF